MRLRNGRLYEAFESEHILLRDGKVVETIQASVFNKVYLLSYQGKNEIGYIKANYFAINEIFNSCKKEYRIDGKEKYAPPSTINKVNTLRILSLNNFLWHTLVSYLYSFKFSATAFKNKLSSFFTEVFKRAIFRYGFFKFSSNYHHAHEVFRKLCFIIKILWSVISVVFIVLLLGSFTNRMSKLPHPHQVGLKSGHEVYLKPNNEIFAWHIMPKSARFIETSPTLSDNFPVILHIRNQGIIDSKSRVDVFHSLASIGFHVIAPINTNSYKQMLEAWIVVYNKAASSTPKYLWVDRTDMSIVKKLMQEACDIGFPPNGVVLETHKNELSTVHTIEVWTESCERSQFNYLRCPITSTSIASKEKDILSCMDFISASTNFRARY